MIDKSYIVYLHINKLNQHTYVGITKQDVKRRWKNGYGYDKCLKFYNAILKYGWDAFEHIILCKASKENAMFLEAVLIAHYKRKGISYNITDGGEENIPSMLGKHHTTKTKNTISSSAKNMWNTRKEELIEKIRYASQNYRRSTKGIKFSEETKLKMQNCHIIPVRCYTLDGHYIATFKSSQEARRQLGIKDKHIGDVCKGKRSKCGEYLWRYDDGSPITDINNKIK